MNISKINVFVNINYKFVNINKFFIIHKIEKIHVNNVLKRNFNVVNYVEIIIFLKF